MRSTSPLLLATLLLVAGSGVAGPEGEPVEKKEGDDPRQAAALGVFRRAVAAQGDIQFAQIADVHLLFRGAIVEEGTHTIVREYWYRAKDRSFRIATQSTADTRRKSERGVVGEKEFWDRAGGAETTTLSRLNRDHRAIMESIERERDDFEGMLRMVILSRLDDGKTRFEFDQETPVTLERDLPFEAAAILGKAGERASLAYHVLRVTREGIPSVRLFIRTSDHTVRKAVVAEGDEPSGTAWHYYFGPYARNGSGLSVPRYLSAHKGEPLDAKSKEETSKARGELLAIDVNRGLAEGDLRPE